MTEPSRQSAVAQPGAGALSALTYSSIAGPLLQEPSRLADLVARLRPSNAGVDVTGVIACDAGCIRQWIEGPAASVALLWDRIRLDPRHRVQWATPPAVVTARHFPGSPMKLAMTTANLARLDPSLIDDVFMLPDTLGRPELFSWPDELGGRFLEGPAGQSAEVARAAVYHLDMASGAKAYRLSAGQAAALADMLTDADAVCARRHLDRILLQTGILGTAALVQAVLDHLQAGWMAGHTSTLQRQLAVTMLQSTLRLRIDVAESPHTIGCALVSVLPGTPDICGAMLKVAILRRAGWSVRLLLPHSTHEILAAKSDLQPDLIVMAGSRLATRPGELGILAELLPALAEMTPVPIIVGGKLAETDPQAVMNRGASAVCGALTWIATIAAHVVETPMRQQQRQVGVLQGSGITLLAERALATFLADARARAGRA